MTEQKQLVEISVTGTLRLEVTKEMFDEIQTKMITMEPIKLCGYSLILDSHNYNSEIVPSGNFLIYLDAVLDTEAQNAI